MKTDDFILIEVESLSRKDRFMWHNPRTKNEKVAKELIVEAIKANVKNFYRPKYDPSFTDDGKGICFVAGKMPAVGKSYNWWKDTAKKYNPLRNSRLGTRLEYGAFLGVLIKKLVESGKSVKWAWNAVCNNSWELGHYKNSEDAKKTFEFTGSREICGFCDLANTWKMVMADDENEALWVAGGIYSISSTLFPIADIYCDNDYEYYDEDEEYSVGWIVLS